MAPPPPKRGTGFINPQTYLAANAGSAGRMQDVLGGWLASRGSKVQSTLSGLEADFDRDVRGGSLEYAPESISEQEARAASTSTYDGPQSLGESEQWASLMGDAGRAQREASQGADYYGRQGLLREQYGKQGGYTPGMARFDSFLSGGNGGQSRFEALKRDFGGLTGGLTAANKASMGKADTARADTARAAQQYGSLADGLAEKRWQDTLNAPKEQNAAAAKDRDDLFGPRKLQGKPYWP